MTDFQTLKQEADQLRQAKKFSHALPVYKQLWENHRTDCSEWEGWGYAYCLKKLEMYKDVLEISRAVYKMKPDFAHNNNVYAWCIYYTGIKVDKVVDEEKFFKAANGIIKILEQEDKSQKMGNDFPCVYTLAVFKVLDYLSDKAIYPADKILEWTGKLNPELLDIQPFSFTTDEGKQRENASPKERYYTMRSKALLEKEMYNECIELSDKALKILTQFHYDNDIWLKRNFALSKAGLKDYDIAIEQLKEILKRKKEWFIQSDIAKILYTQKKYDEALQYSIDAALNIGEVGKKIKLYQLLASVLKVQGKLEEAKKHIELVYLVRQEHNWKIKDNLNSLLKSYNIDTTKLPTLNQLQNELKQIWEKLKFSGQPLLEGKIKNILQTGKAGFIESNDKKSYFFSVKEFRGKKELLKQGQRVSFYLEEGFDKKKNQPTKNAVNVKPIN